MNPLISEPRIGYKLIRVRANGTLGSLFIHRQAVLPVGEWLQAEAHATPGYAFRPGWHVMTSPHAPHLSTRGRLWHEVEVVDYQVFDRPASQGGVWLLAQKMKIIRPL